MTRSEHDWQKRVPAEENQERGKKGKNGRDNKYAELERSQGEVHHASNVAVGKRVKLFSLVRFGS